MAEPPVREKILQPPHIGLLDDKKNFYRFISELWERSGGYESAITNLDGLKSSVSELNTLIGIHTDDTVQEQLDSKQKSLGTGTVDQYLRGDLTFNTLNTAAVTESTNLYFTVDRARDSISATAPIDYTTGVLSIPVADTSTDGYLSALDWNRFDSGIVPVTGNLTESTSSVLTITGGTGAVIGTGTNIEVKASSANTVSYLVLRDAFGFSEFKGVRFVDSGTNTLTWYSADAEYINFTGIWASAQSVRLFFERIGDIVTIGFRETLATSNTASYITSGTIPSEYIPTVDYEFFIARTVDNGSEASAGSLVKILSSGEIEIYDGVGNFSGSGSSGFKPFSVTYSIVTM